MKMSKHKTKNANIIALIPVMVLSLVLLACSKGGDPEPGSGPVLTGEVTGTVKDENGNPYPSTLVSISKGSEKTARATNEIGGYTIKTKDIGTYTMEVTLPLSTKLVSSPVSTVNVVADNAVTVDLIIQPQPAMAHLNFGNVQLLEEIVDANGNTPVSPSEPLFAKNIFDDPIGHLTAIKAPDGHQVTLAEFKTANGSLVVHCNGNSSTIEIDLQGMIPNGTYTFWLAYLNIARKVGESIDFANDFVNMTNPPIGSSSGTVNIAVAGADGSIQVTLEHASCILTDEVALVIPILYHINGKTFGGGHVPDAEEMVHMLVYFQ